MFVLGHIGITMGSALVLKQLTRVLPNRLRLKAFQETAKPEKDPSRDTSSAGIGPAGILACTVGAILPDLIDKPAGHFLFSETFGNNGRIFSHTLLFALVILGIAVYISLSREKTWGLYAAFGVLMHLALDYMWRTPQTLMWPLYGLNFPVLEERVPWLERMVFTLTNDPSAYLPELIGLAIIFLWLILALRSRQNLFIIRTKRR